MNNINNLLAIFQNYNLSQINTEIDCDSPIFLENPAKRSLKVVKSDLQLYEREYVELSEEVNNLTNLSIELFDNLTYSI